MWSYNNVEFTEDMIGDSFGYVYEITNNTNGRKYVGKKFFTRAGTKQIKGKKKKVRLSSGWANYWSSSEELKADVKKLGRETNTHQKTWTEKQQKQRLRTINYKHQTKITKQPVIEEQ